MLDRTYIRYIKNSKLLNDNSKKIYLARLEVIQYDIWKNCKSINHKVGKGKCLHYIITHPDAFIEKIKPADVKAKRNNKDVIVCDNGTSWHLVVSCRHRVSIENL